METLPTRLLALGQRPRHDLNLLCCHLVIGLNRFVGADGMIQQTLEAVGDVAILPDAAVGAIRGPHDRWRLLHLTGPGLVQDQGQKHRLQVRRQEISIPLEIFRHRDLLFSVDRECLRGRPWHQDIHGLLHPCGSFVSGRSQFIKQNKGPRRPAVPKTPPQQKTADELLDNLLRSHEEERRGQAASSSARFNDVSDTAPNPAEVEEVFEAVYEASTLELERQLGIVDACNTFSGENPLTPLQAYMAFVLQYRINPRGDSRLIPKHAEMREVQDRQRAAFEWARSWTSISQSEIDEVILDLFALFPAGEPAPKSISGLTLRTFAQSLLSAKVSVSEHFVSAASYNVPNVNSCMYFFKVKDFPGPPPTQGKHMHGRIAVTKRALSEFCRWAEFAHCSL